MVERVLEFCNIQNRDHFVPYRRHFMKFQHIFHETIDVSDDLTFYCRYIYCHFIAYHDFLHHVSFHVRLGRLCLKLDETEREMIVTRIFQSLE